MAARPSSGPLRTAQLEASEQAVYGKRHRVPPGLSCGFLADSTARLRDVFPEGVISPAPESLRDFRVINLDGKKIKHLPKRLLPARKLKGHVYGGKRSDQTHPGRKKAVHPRRPHLHPTPLEQGQTDKTKMLKAVGYKSVLRVAI